MDLPQSDQRIRATMLWWAEFLEKSSAITLDRSRRIILGEA